MTPCTMSSAVAIVGPLPAESHAARRACPPEYSMTRDRVMPPAMIARISSSVGTPAPIAPPRSPGATPKAVRASSTATAVPAAGATHAGSRVSSSTRVSRMGESASSTSTAHPLPSCTAPHCRRGVGPTPLPLLWGS